MNWIKRKLIFNACAQNDLMYSHAQIPAPLKLDDSIYRIYFSSRDRAGKTRPFFLEYDFAKETVIRVMEKPLFEHGPIGSFDDSGIMPSSLIRVDGLIYMYYIAWNPQITVSYRLSIGLAISNNDGLTFEKYSEGPLLDRSIEEPYFNTAPCVIKEGDCYFMWYVSCTGWRLVDGKTEPLYLIRRAVSSDGKIWHKDREPSISYKYDGEAIGRPWVIKYQGKYRMWYSSRGSFGYRSAAGQHYNLGYAESEDGLKWFRKDESVGIGCSENDEWDSEMTEYCSVISDSSRLYMLYNGNGFGKTGFGYAQLD